LKKVIISVTNDIVNDQRILRTASTFHKAGWKVELVGRRIRDGLPASHVHHQMYRFRMVFKRGPFFYGSYNVRLFFHLLFHPCDLLWANDLDTLPANYLASRCLKTTLVYDAHEYFTEVPELLDRKPVQWIWKRIESGILPKLKHVITVSDSIAAEYTRRYGIPVGVVRNFPRQLSGMDRPESFNGDQKKVILYQGTLNRNRGLEPMIRAMAFISDARLFIVGNGPEKERLVKLVRDLELDERVQFISKMLPHQLQRLTPDADLGLSIEEDRGMNYRYALPNKLFDYIYAGVPVLVSPLPEMVRIVERHRVGWVLESYKPEKMAGQVNRIIQSLDHSGDELAGNLRNASAELNWEKEEPRLLVFIHSLPHYL
jgi:glycosyltransferase involved in cell wall biosynthesis